MRKQIEMTEAQTWEFLRSRDMGVFGTVGRDGAPHLVTVLYLVCDGFIDITSYAKAQKVLNAQRNPVGSLLVEIPKPYASVKGALLRGPLEVLEDVALTESVMYAVGDQYARVDAENWAVNPKVDIPKVAPKRLVLRLHVQKIVSWDHAHLGAGVY